MSFYRPQLFYFSPGLPLFRRWSSSQNINASNYEKYLCFCNKPPWALNIYTSNNTQAQPSHLMAGHVVLLKIVFFCFHFCTVHAQQLSQWSSYTVGGPRSLCVFIDWATCLKRLRTPDIANNNTHSYGVNV